jgi:hypothetical protein
MGVCDDNRNENQSRMTPRGIQWYHGCDAVSGSLLLGMAVLSPWAFGTTEPWSIWIMTSGGFLLGLLWLIKCAVRHAGYLPARWDEIPAEGRRGRNSAALRGWTMTLGAVTVLFLGLVLMSAWNGRAHYDPGGLHFEYRDVIGWLPSSMEANSTWFAFWQYAGLAAGFWAARDWFLGLSAGEWRARHGSKRDGAQNARSSRRTDARLLPARMRWLLWVLCVNGALVGLMGIVQRLEGSGRLLFLVQPEVNPAAVTQFGPWAYRANAAQFFNLLWPVSIGFWWILQRGGGTRYGAHHGLLVAGIIMAACPVISTSRGGALVAFGITALGGLGWLGSMLFWSVPAGMRPMRRWATLGAILLFYGMSLWLGLKLGWPALEPRMSDFKLGWEAREQMFDTARPMAIDYPWLGTGAGTFGKVFQLYRGSYETYWPAELHNDWLELRITLGYVGLGLVLSALTLVWIRWWLPGGIRGGRRLVWSLWLGQIGCLVHARWDFPFQIHSIVFLFVLWAAVLSCLSRR